MKEMLVTIVIPCYNAEEYLSGIITDIQQQQYPNIETVIVSNGEKQERQLETVREQIVDMTNIQVLHTDEAGVSNARNLGLLSAKGEWICFIDADDRIRPNHIQLLVEAIDDDCDVIEGGFEQIDINGQSAKVTYPNTKYDLTLEKNGLYKERVSDVIHKVGNAPWNKLFRRSFLINSKLLFDTKYTMNEDRIFAMSAFLKARNWKFIPMTGYIYKASYGSAMSRYHANVEESWTDYLDLRDKIKLRSGQDKAQICQERIDMQYYLVWQYIWNMFKPGCPYPFSTKVIKIRELMNDEDFATSCRFHDWKKESLRYKLFYRCIRTGSPLIVALLFGSQHYGKQLVNLLKR